MKPEKVAAYIRIKGRVQGVGYRFFAQDKAEAYHLKGWVRNVPGGEVECEVEGPEADITSFLQELRQGPPIARVDAVEVDWRPATDQFRDFSIR
jgi:acylphosphatase